MTPIHTVSSAGPARIDIPLDRPGRTIGAMRVPYSRDTSAYGQIVIPIIVITGRPGPTVLLTGGVHGDEYEGQIALGQLARELDPGLLRGRVIIVPTANPPASLAGRRTSPLDGGNLARLFPGRADGGPTAQIAEGISRLLLPEADYLVDLHSGGGSLEYQPCGFGRLPAEPAARPAVIDLLLAFGAPITAVVAQPDASGTLVAAALERGVPAIATEIGGGGGVTGASLAVARDGVRRVLAHVGLLDPGPAPPASRLLVVEPAHFLRATRRGLFAPAFNLGDRVEEGDHAGVVLDPERPDLAGESLRFAASGVVICRRVPALTEPGDVLAHLGADVTRAALISRSASGPAR